MRHVLFAATLFFVSGLASAGEAPVVGPVEGSTSRVATKEELALLTDALTKVAQEMPRWAYTETLLLKDEKGKVKESKSVRHDPSKPYAEQDIPLLIAGKPPTESQLKEYRTRGEKLGRKMQDAEGLGRAPPAKQSVGDLVDLTTAWVVEEKDGHLIYELPLRKIGNTRFPPEKFQVLVRVAKTGHILEHAEVKLRESMRTKLIVKIKSGEAVAEFTVVDPKYPPAMTAVRGNASASILFVSVGGNLDVTHTELKHVRPFAEKFDVQIGPMKALDF